VTTREFWESCQRKAASANSGVEWLSIRVTSTYPDRLRFPLLGLTSVTAVTVTARIEYLGAKHTISDTNYWVRVAGKWRGLWKPEQTTHTPGNAAHRPERPTATSETAI
jgi:hypothetical protein